MFENIHVYIPSVAAKNQQLLDRVGGTIPYSSMDVVGTYSPYHHTI